MCVWLLVGLLAVTSLGAKETNQIRVGVLKFGTVNWELDVVLAHGLAKRNDVDLVVVPLASKSATQVAIQGGAVDVIVSDWIWVSRQRAEGRDYTFVPYSTAVGALMVDPKSGIETLADMEGKRLGVAGGPVDKSWLLLRAYSRRKLGEDLAEIVEPSFAAPPLLNELALRGELPAVLNYWHYSARLHASGLKALLRVKDLLPELDVVGVVPLVGWVFHEKWAKAQRKTLTGFLQASFAAKTILNDSDAEWERLRPMLKVSDDATMIALRDAYRAGIPTCFGDSEIAASKKIFEILAQEGGKALVGRSRTLSDGTFWAGYEIGPCPQ
jgi:NitT/TauT family transport system substrate-binding protein